MRNKRCSREESLALLRDYKTPEHVIRHCIAVTDTALAIGRALNAHGLQLDLDLIQGAALIHDIARVEDRHWDVGADIAESRGLPEEADIIRKHMFYTPCLTADALTELDLVCLGDRLVREDQFVGLVSRMQYILEKARLHGDTQAEAIIRKKTADLQRLVDDIEQRLGVSLETLVKEKG